MKFTEDQLKRLKGRAARFGLSLDVLLDELEKQNYQCELCNKELELFGKGNSAINHCYETQAVRGILCGYCNSLLGRIQKRITVDRIKTYLTKQPIGVKPDKKARGGQRKEVKKTNYECVRLYRLRKRYGITPDQFEIYTKDWFVQQGIW
jgi:DNA-directed RNA polymerase subunit RPC12/RpoP